jgi:hypothetical protein
MCVYKEDRRAQSCLNVGLWSAEGGNLLFSLVSQFRVESLGFRGSPASENFLFSSVGLSFEVLNNDRVVVFAVCGPSAPEIHARA